MSLVESAEYDSELLAQLRTGGRLPEFVFARPYLKYLFFDADLRSSEPLIAGIRDVAANWLGGNIRIRMFSHSDCAGLAWLEPDEDWAVKVAAVNAGLSDALDSGGLIFADATFRMVAVQGTPMDVGVLAVDPASGSGRPTTGLKESFFDRQDVSDWLEGKSDRNVSMVETFGREYLESLKKNYS